MSDKVIDLDKEDLTNLEVLKNRGRFLLDELGQISLLEITLEERKESAKAFRLKTKEMEKELAEFLENKYGKGNVDLDTGKFTPKTV
jgi:hypothetical protein